MSSTEAQNGFGHLLDRVSKNDTVVITKHAAAHAVIMSVERYEALTQEESSILDDLTDEFNALLAGMQTPAARAAVRDAFRASPDELARAAIAAARRAG
ncbi:hypothetical protein BH20GEM2_BH20GEM2_08750 [soil metagenome]